MQQRRYTYSTLRRLAALALLAGSGCGEVADGGLSNAKDSPEQLARAVLEALAANDRAGLEAVWITREEHRALLWDELPERNAMSFDRAWLMNQRNTEEGIGRALDRYGGQEFELVTIAFTEEPEVYETFTLHFGTELRVRRVSDGREGELPILDVVLERNGRWKLLNYEE